MEKTNYFSSLKELEEKNIQRDYITGWATGAQGSPKLEEQRVTEAYDAGFADGQAGHIDSHESWKTS